MVVHHSGIEPRTSRGWGNLFCVVNSWGSLLKSYLSGSNSAQAFLHFVGQTFRLSRSPSDHPTVRFLSSFMVGSAVICERRDFSIDGIRLWRQTYRLTIFTPFDGRSELDQRDVAVQRFSESWFLMILISLSHNPDARLHFTSSFYKFYARK